MRTPAPSRPESAGAREPVLVGSFFWTLQRGDRWVLGPASTFLFRDCWRKALVREAYLLDQPCSRAELWRDAIQSVARRLVTGEPLLLDLYVAERDGAELAISSDEIGGNLYLTSLARGALICRRTVYFGSEVDVELRLASPLWDRGADGGRLPLADRIKRAAYGPGWIFQRFVPRSNARATRLILQIDGDASLRELRKGETLRCDPRHVYAWDESVSYRLVEFGAVLDRLLRGDVPFQVEFEGPGAVWISDMSFSNGYLGEVCSPSHWVFRLSQGVRRLLGLLNPFHWL